VKGVGKCDKIGSMGSVFMIIDDLNDKLFV
jgi:hypothetical protein